MFQKRGVKTGLGRLLLSELRPRGTTSGGTSTGATTSRATSIQTLEEKRKAQVGGEICVDAFEVLFKF